MGSDLATLPAINASASTTCLKIQSLNREGVRSSLPSPDHEWARNYPVFFCFLSRVLFSYGNRFKPVTMLGLATLGCPTTCSAVHAKLPTNSPNTSGLSI